MHVLRNFRVFLGPAQQPDDDASRLVHSSSTYMYLFRESCSRRRFQPYDCVITHFIRYDTIRDAILTSARKPTWVSLIYRTQGLNWGRSRRISDPAPLVWDPLPLITDPVLHNWDLAPSCWDPPLCWVEFKHQTLLKCHKSQTECPECSTTPGRRSGTPPLLSVLRVRASALQASRL